MQGEIPDLVPTDVVELAEGVGGASKGRGRFRRPPPPANREQGRSQDFDIIVGHPLHPVDNPHIYPWSAVVLLHIRFQSGATAHGTGWFFSPSRIGTAAHNLLHPREGAATGMDILAGWEDVNSAERFSIAAKYVAPAWAPPGDEANDWAIIGIDHPPATKLGYFGFRAYDQGYLPGLQLYVSGYPGDEYGVIPTSGVAGTENQCWDSGSSSTSRRSSSTTAYLRRLA